LHSGQPARNGKTALNHNPDGNVDEEQAKKKTVLGSNKGGKKGQGLSKAKNAVHKTGQQCFRSSRKPPPKSKPKDVLLEPCPGQGVCWRDGVQILAWQKSNATCRPKESGNAPASNRANFPGICWENEGTRGEIDKKLSAAHCKKKRHGPVSRRTMHPPKPKKPGNKGALGGKSGHNRKNQKQLKTTSSEGLAIHTNIGKKRPRVTLGQNVQKDGQGGHQRWYPETKL